MTKLTTCSDITLETRLITLLFLYIKTRQACVDIVQNTIIIVKLFDWDRTGEHDNLGKLVFDLLLCRFTNVSVSKFFLYKEIFFYLHQIYESHKSSNFCFP